jgi:hypothetical protein
VARVHDVARGNPFFSLEVARALRDSQVPGHLDSRPVSDMRAPLHDRSFQSKQTRR